MTWEITAGLAHDPYWSTLGMLTASCTQDEVVLERGEVGHCGDNLGSRAQPHLCCSFNQAMSNPEQLIDERVPIPLADPC